jgi:hypothetical protein
MDADTLDPDQLQQLYKFIQPPAMAQGMAMQNAGAPSTPPAGGAPPPPTDIAQAGETATKGDQDTDTKIADSHPGLAPGALDSYIQGQEKGVDKFGPDKQAAVMDMIAKQNNSLGNRIGRGGSAFADAIMQGVARAGNPGFLKSYDDRQKTLADRAIEGGKSLNEQQQTGLKEKQGLEEMSPATPLGASNLPMLQSVAKMYGMSPSAVASLAKTNPKTAIDMLNKVGEFATGKMKAEVEQELKILEIQVQQANAQAMQGIARSGKDIEAKKEQTEKDKAILGAGSPLNPFNPVTHQQKKAALSDLGGGGQTFTPDVTAYAQKHGITPEQAQTVKNKRTGGQ